jgi:ATP-dependent helicase Lhr and Lhr-like helicase
MSENPFQRLAPFIQEFIYSHNWTELRQVQVEACRVIFDTDAHLLLAAGTASGKTEAAFLPILTLLHENPSDSVGVLYIGPLKALINDQFMRLNELLKEAGMPVCHWHGDVSVSEKQKFLRSPRGVLQITPESLESLLINRRAMLAPIFADLRFIVIDEVHAFMGSDRGRQVLCQLQRLSEYMKKQPRRVGLSATLGDYRFAEEWLQSGTERPVMTPRISVGQQRARLAVEHFIVPAAAGTEQLGTEQLSQSPEPGKVPRFYEYIYDLTRSKKALIFANSRGETESVIAMLRAIAESQHQPDFYHVHHGSISAALRKAAEEAMRDPVQPAVTAATVTLELGIDIGQLERVIQLDSPFSVASFLQRLGRSGRRGQAAELWCVCREEEGSNQEDTPDQFPWPLLQAIAIMQLYLEEKWIEPIPPKRLPVSLLYHQTMSTLLAAGELTPPVLAERVLRLAPFKHVSTDQYRELLLHLLALDHVQKTEEGGLIVGLAGEQITGNYRFYSVFSENPEFIVYSEGNQIGTIFNPPPVGDHFALAGRAWEVLESDSKRRTLNAKPVKGRARARWRGGSREIHDRILQRVRQVLMEDTQYPYLQPGARERLDSARMFARSMGLPNRLVVSLSENQHCILPWVGTVACRTLARVIQSSESESLRSCRISGASPYYLLVDTVGALDSTEVEAAIIASLTATASEMELVQADEEPRLEKYDEFIPGALLRCAFGADRLNLESLRREFMPPGNDRQNAPNISTATGRE